MQSQGQLSCGVSHNVDFSDCFLMIRLSETSFCKNMIRCCGQPLHHNKEHMLGGPVPGDARFDCLVTMVYATSLHCKETVVNKLV